MRHAFSTCSNFCSLHHPEYLSELSLPVWPKIISAMQLGRYCVISPTLFLFIYIQYEAKWWDAWLICLCLKQLQSKSFFSLFSSVVFMSSALNTLNVLIQHMLVNYFVLSSKMLLILLNSTYWRGVHCQILCEGLVWTWKLWGVGMETCSGM